MTDRFTDACRINQAEPGVFSWDVPAGWLQGRGAWGGLVIAASVNAVEVTQQHGSGLAAGWCLNWAKRLRMMRTDGYGSARKCLWWADPWLRCVCLCMWL